MPFQFDDDETIMGSDDVDAPPTALLLFADAPSTDEELAGVVSSGGASSGAGAEELPRFEFEADDGLSRKSAAEN